MLVLNDPSINSRKILCRIKLRRIGGGGSLKATDFLNMILYEIKTSRHLRGKSLVWILKEMNILTIYSYFTSPSSSSTTSYVFYHLHDSMKCNLSHGLFILSVYHFQKRKKKPSLINPLELRIKIEMRKMIRIRWLKEWLMRMYIGKRYFYEKRYAYGEKIYVREKWEVEVGKRYRVEKMCERHGELMKSEEYLKSVELSFSIIQAIYFPESSVLSESFVSGLVNAQSAASSHICALGYYLVRINSRICEKWISDNWKLFRRCCVAIIWLTLFLLDAFLKLRGLLRGGGST